MTNASRPAPSFPKRALIAGSLLLAAGCFPPTAQPPAALPADSLAWGATRGLSADALEQGHKLFVANCNQCHGYPKVTAYTPERWPKLVDWMGKKAHLAAPDRDAVLNFVLAYRVSQSGQ